MEKLNGYINQYNISNSSFEFLFNGLTNALPLSLHTLQFNKLILNSSYGKLGQREKYTYYESYDNIPELKAFKFSIKFRREIKDIDTNYIIENIRNQSFNYVMLISYKSSLKRTPK